VFEPAPTHTQRTHEDRFRSRCCPGVGMVQRASSRSTNGRYANSAHSLPSRRTVGLHTHYPLPILTSRIGSTTVLVLFSILLLLQPQPSSPSTGLLSELEMAARGRQGLKLTFRAGRDSAPITGLPQHFSSEFNKLKIFSDFSLFTGTKASARRFS